jgi:hypothetical protein
MFDGTLVPLWNPLRGTMAQASNVAVYHLASCGVLAMSSEQMEEPGS